MHMCPSQWKKPIPSAEFVKKKRVQQENIYLWITAEESDSGHAGPGNMVFVPRPLLMPRRLANKPNMSV